MNFFPNGANVWRVNTRSYPPRGRGRGEARTSPRRVEAAQRAAEVVRLRIEGWTWQAIADALGFRDRSGPFKAFDRFWDRYNAGEREREARLARRRARYASRRNAK